jgi:hypothetical protein
VTDEICWNNNFKRVYCELVSGRCTSVNRENFMSVFIFMNSGQITNFNTAKTTHFPVFIANAKFNRRETEKFTNFTSYENFTVYSIEKDLCDKVQRREFVALS